MLSFLHKSLWLFIVPFFHSFFYKLYNLLKVKNNLLKNRLGMIWSTNIIWSPQIVSKNQIWELCLDLCLTNILRVMLRAMLRVNIASLLNALWPKDANLSFTFWQNLPVSVHMAINWHQFVRKLCEKQLTVKLNWKPEWQSSLPKAKLQSSMAKLNTEAQHRSSTTKRIESKLLKR